MKHIAEILPSVLAHLWPADKAICYGVACPVHANCARYAAVEGNSNEAQRKQGRCEERAGYIPIKELTT